MAVHIGNKGSDFDVPFALAVRSFLVERGWECGGLFGDGHYSSRLDCGTFFYVLAGRECERTWQVLLLEPGLGSRRRLVPVFGAVGVRGDEVEVAGAGGRRGCALSDPGCFEWIDGVVGELWDLVDVPL